MKWFNKFDKTTKMFVVGLFVIIILGIIGSISKADSMTLKSIKSYCFAPYEMSEMEAQIGKVLSIEPVTEVNKTGIQLIRIDSEKADSIAGLLPDGTTCFIWGLEKEGQEG